MPMRPVIISGTNQRWFRTLLSTTDDDDLVPFGSADRADANQVARDVGDLYFPQLIKL